jgi:hypothetical protein
MEAGACASVKVIPCFENFSIFGVFRVFEIGIEFLNNDTPK